MEDNITTDTETGLDITEAEEIETTAETKNETEIETANDETTGGEAEDETVKDDLPPELATGGNTRMDTEARWYVLHTFNGYEAIAEDNLKKVIEKYKLQDRILEIFIPKESNLVERNGKGGETKKVMVESRTMPTYIFMKMIYGDDLWHTITRTRGITGFVGPKGRPLPLTAGDVMKMKLEKKLNITTKIEVDDTVQVIDGPLAGQTARVTAVDPATDKVTVTVTMFGRSNKVDLHNTQVKKM